MKSLNLTILDDDLAVMSLKAGSVIPESMCASDFLSVCKTDEELSIICSSHLVSEEFNAEAGWVAIKVIGRLDLSHTGIVAAIAEPLAKAEISIFAFSTFKTDYILVKNERLSEAKSVLEQAGHTFI